MEEFIEADLDLIKDTEVEDGKTPTIVVLGKTGQGKSTLLNFLQLGPEYLLLKGDEKK